MRVCFLVGLVLLLVGCVSFYPSEKIVEPPAITTQRLEGRPWEELLPQLKPEIQEIFLDFADNAVPEQLPELAFANAFFLRSYAATMENDLIVSLRDGYASSEIVVANMGTNVNQANLICLRNGVQVHCTPEVQVWEIHQLPHTMNIVATTIEAEKGDQLTFLLMPERESERARVASKLISTFVEERRLPLSDTVIAPAHERVLGGCDIATLITDTTPSDTYRIPGEQKRGAPLYFLSQLCTLPENVYWQLVPIIDRLYVAPLEAEVWQQPTQQVSSDIVIPIHTEELENGNEFQVAIIALTEEAEGLLREQFTHAVKFID